MKITGILVAAFIGVIIIGCSTIEGTKQKEELQRAQSSQRELEAFDARRDAEQQLRKILETEELVYSQAGFENFRQTSKDTIALYERFIQTGPGGEFVTEAKRRIEKLAAVTETEFAGYVAFRKNIIDMISGGPTKVLGQKKTRDIQGDYSIIEIENLLKEWTKAAGMKVLMSGPTTISEIIEPGQKKRLNLTNGKYNIAVTLVTPHLAPMAFMDLGYTYTGGEYTMSFAFWYPPSHDGGPGLYAMSRYPSPSERIEAIEQALNRIMEHEGVNIFRGQAER